MKSTIQNLTGDVPKLLAIVSVDQHDQVQCQQPGSGRGVYQAIHVVTESGKPLVLGSTCFLKRYGVGHSFGAPKYGMGGDGRKLTPEERQLLVENTQSLLAQFEDEACAQALREATAADRRQDGWDGKADPEKRSVVLNTH